MERLAKKIFEGLQIDISQVANGQYDGWLTGLDIPGVFADAAHHYHSCRNLIALNFKKRHGSTIGLVWRGNPDFQDEAWRMVPYKDLLKNISSKSSDIDLMIFHQDLNLEETQAINETRQPWQASHGDWLDTAEKLLQVKQLIGSDTGVIHLAGLLGVPVQLLLYKTYGWLWPRVKNQSYWYPSVKIIQQSKLLAWDEPIDAISLN
jgi:ADP-heptose:LPS heptosyltransferase